MSDFEDLTNSLSNDSKKYWIKEKTLSNSHCQAKPNPYQALFEDPCYCYSKQSKMAFFNNKVCSMLFLLSTQFVWEQLPLAKNYDKDCSNAILLEFVNLSL